MWFFALVWNTDVFSFYGLNPPGNKQRCSSRFWMDLLPLIINTLFSFWIHVKAPESPGLLCLSSQLGEQTRAALSDASRLRQDRALHRSLNPFQWSHVVLRETLEGLTDTRASVTLVRTAGRRECTRILCSVTAKTNRVTVFSGPRFRSSVEKLPPLESAQRVPLKRVDPTGIFHYSKTRMTSDPCVSLNKRHSDLESQISGPTFGKRGCFF